MGKRRPWRRGLAQGLALGLRFLNFQATLAKCGSGPEALTVSRTTVLDYLLCAGHIPGMLTDLILVVTLASRPLWSHMRGEDTRA